MLRRRLRASLVPEGKLWLDAHPTPVLINRYDRLYFETPDGSLRATLDRHQAVFDQRLKSRPNLRYRSNLPDSVVVEIKFHRADRRRATEVIEGLPLRVSRNSKYVIGVRSILQPLGG